jgi:hypothetical protein
MIRRCRGFLVDAVYAMTWLAKARLRGMDREAIP